MGYVICYGDGERSPVPQKGVRSRFVSLTVTFFLAFLLLTRLFWPAGSEKLREYLLPGDPDVTAGAISALVEDLRAGESLHTSVTAFCSEILAHAEYPD